MKKTQNFCYHKNGKEWLFATHSHELKITGIHIKNIRLLEYILLLSSKQSFRMCSIVKDSPVEPFINNLFECHLPLENKLLVLFSFPSFYFYILEDGSTMLHFEQP